MRMETMRYSHRLFARNETYITKRKLTYSMKYKRLSKLIALLFISQGMYAQSYNNDVGQYCHRVNNHPLRCNMDYEFGGAVYGGLVWSSTSGSVAGKHDLGGLDIGAKFTNSWGYTCKNIQVELNAYVDLKYATRISTKDDTDGISILGDTPSENKDYTDYAAQLTIAPGIRINKWSFDCGPYVAYSAYGSNVEEIFSSPDVSGMEFGIRVGTALHFTKTQLGLYYDIALSDQDKKFKKNDLMLYIGYQF